MRVEYNLEFLQSCQCGMCPVHDGSQCINQKTNGLKFTTCSSTPSPQDGSVVVRSSTTARNGLSLFNN